MSRNQPIPDQLVLTLDVEPLPAILKGLRPLDEELHGEPLDAEYGPDFGGVETHGEWSPGGRGWTNGETGAIGFDALDAQTRSQKHPTADQLVATNPAAIWGHTARCGTMASPGMCTCGASAIGRAGGNVQPAGDHTSGLVFSERRGTVLWTGGYLVEEWAS